MKKQTPNSNQIYFFFIHEQAFMVKINIESRYYFSFECLYPFAGIPGNYFNENISFFEDSSVELIKAVVFTNLIGFLKVYQSRNDIVNELRLRKIDVQKDKINKEIINHIQDQYSSEFISKHTFDKLTEFTAQYIRFKTLSYQNLDNTSIIEEKLEMIASRALKEGISEIFFFNYDTDLFTGSRCSMKINLQKSDFPEDLLLQELFRWMYTAPENTKKENPFLKDYFTEKFLSFSQQKQLSLFLYCNVDKSLFLYNNAIKTWWANRY